MGQTRVSKTFPYVFFGSSETWFYVSTQGGIPLDRLRLSELVRDEDVSPLVMTRIRAWCEDFAGKLPAAD